MRFVASGVGFALVLGVLAAGPAVAQRGDAPAVLTAGDVARTDRRLSKLEGELRAVQRKVFPGGSGAAIEPEITAPAAPAMGIGGVPASNPLIDFGQRVGDMERQLRTLTGQVEANEFKVRQLESALKLLQGDLEFRLARLEGAGAPAEDVSGSAGARIGAAAPPLPAPIAGTRTGQMLPPVGTARVPAAPIAPAAVPTAEPTVPKGSTAVIAWQAAYGRALAKDWPGAEAHMTAYLANWPQSTRIPQAQFWLGRSFAERNLHAQAAEAFLKVYNSYPTSERAPDALLGLAGALLGIKNPQQGCRVLGELDSVYGKSLTSAQKAEAKALRTRARCAA